MTRVPDWESRLAAYLVEAEGRPHVYGQHDCTTFAAGAVMAMTGVDPMPEFRGRYSTAKGSAMALRRYGAGTLEATMDAKFEAIGRAFARRGDVVLFESAVGVCIGADAMFVGTDDEKPGLIRVPRALWLKAWRAS
jgi:hypothetical protein